MDKAKRNKSLIIFCVIAIIMLIGSILSANPGGEEESIQEVMRDAVLHESNKIAFLGMDVNPGLIAAFVTTGILSIFAIIIRIFVIPKFTMVPGKFQMILETIVGMFDNMAKGNSPKINKFLGGYIFTAGAYIFTGTLLELFGLQVVTTSGLSISIPAPLSDINGAIMMGCLSYLVILSGGIAGNGIKGVGATLKEFSLPISMSFRLFGALISGALVTELVYYFSALSYGVPVLVGVLFTALHALIQAYVLTMLTSLFYGEVSEKTEPKPKKSKKLKENKEIAQPAA